MPPPPTPPLSNAKQKGTQHAQATSKEDKTKLEPSVATGCVDGSTPMAWQNRPMVAESRRTFVSACPSECGARSVDVRCLVMPTGRHGVTPSSYMTR